MVDQTADFPKNILSELDEWNHAIFKLGIGSELEFECSEERRTTSA